MRGVEIEELKCMVNCVEMRGRTYVISGARVYKRGALRIYVEGRAYIGEMDDYSL